MTCPRVGGMKTLWTSTLLDVSLKVTPSPVLLHSSLAVDPPAGLGWHFVLQPSGQKGWKWAVWIWTPFKSKNYNRALPTGAGGTGLINIPACRPDEHRYWAKYAFIEHATHDKIAFVCVCVCPPLCWEIRSVMHKTTVVLKLNPTLM